MMKMSNADIGFSEDEIQQMLDNIDTFTPDEAMEIDKLVDELNNRKANKIIIWATINTVNSLFALIKFI